MNQRLWVARIDAKQVAHRSQETIVARKGLDLWLAYFFNIAAGTLEAIKRRECVSFGRELADIGPALRIVVRN